MSEAIRWDGKPETVARLRELFPECIESYSSDILHVRGFRNTSARKGVHDSRIVPLGWYVTRKVNAHGPYMALIPPEKVHA